ncbi:unnamed protein product, partial [Linum tenue]
GVSPINFLYPFIDDRASTGLQWRSLERSSSSSPMQRNSGGLAGGELPLLESNTLC